MLADPEVIALTDGTTAVQLPDPATALAFRTTTTGRSDLYVVGPRTRGRYHPVKGVPVCVRLRLRPGVARATLGVPVQALVDKTLPLTDLWGPDATEVADALIAAGRDTTRVLAVLQDAIGARVAGQAGGLLAAAVRELSTVPRLADVAARLGVSERHLRNIFARETGLSPKHYARITRVRRVLAQADASRVRRVLDQVDASRVRHAPDQADASRVRHAPGQADASLVRHAPDQADASRVRHAPGQAGAARRWAAVADDAGFFDQAHMISDFRSFMGVTPAAYAAGRLPPATPCAELARLAATAQV
ncbi:hypothetical protein Aab01nite_17240 [Paractinoplanes abujensis]|uniref:AraC-like DNA-binding protein n=1 Tax=Paractinoplanes abujensis TaxID=882441 RepID=A0A7W7G6F9_9ACTN|nr:helix-turn-helix domain-containing protein [Actinoplanes abujensis]MBB4697390.1 AraC-like DNA-binding protein [Actinoplanes abujensis]GID18134.1 hypothetical protein Aab01nite_17240 [Actinoplanes abujensis]